MKQNKVILFDWGNIVESHFTGYTCYDAFDDLFKECGYTCEDRVFDHLGKYKLSSITNDEEFRNIYELMSKDFNLNKTYDEFKDIYKKVFDRIDYYQEVADYQHSLKDKCYIGIFSNLTIFDKERLDRQCNLSMYDYVFLSFELGMKKPNKDIFEYAESKLPFNKEDILFIDDREDNIKMASSLGWNTLQATGLELDKIKNKCIEFINK